MDVNDANEGPIVDLRTAAGWIGFFAVLVLCGWAEVRLVWWAIDAAASLAS